MSPQAVAPQPKPPVAPILVSVDGRAYPLRSAEVRAHAEGGLAFTTLIQEFENPYEEPLEVLYTMPLPADGAVLGYLIRMGERVIRGEIETRENAAAEYKRALFEGLTAGLLEQDRADTFQQRLGNLPARTNARIEIDVLHPLAFLLGVEEHGPVWEYRFPTVVGVRYEGGPGRVKDAERLDVDRAGGGEIPTRVTLHLELADAAGGAAVASPSHELRLRSGNGATRVELADDARLDRDLIIHWSAATNDVGVRVVEGAGLKGDDGRYGLVTVTPPARAASVYSRDLTVLIDASGSMRGEPLAIAKRIVSDLLRSLLEGDRFELLAFSSHVVRLSHGLSGATPGAIRKCLDQLDRLEAGGGTEMREAVAEAMTSLRPESQRQVILVSDGYIGFEAEIVHRVASELPPGVRMHAIGVGAAPNRSLTSGVARAGRGLELFASDERTAGVASRRLRAATVGPVLTEPTIGGSAVVAYAPARPRDVLAGQPLVLAVELRPEGGTLEVSGQLAGREGAWVWRMDVAPGGTSGTALPLGALHGRERILDLEAGLVAPGRDHDLNRAIETLALRHRVVSRRTSLVAVAEEPSVDPRMPRRRERLPVEMPHGVSSEGVGLGRASLAGSLAYHRVHNVLSLREVAQAVETSMGALQFNLGRAELDRIPIEIRCVNVFWPDATIMIIEFKPPRRGFLLPTRGVRVIGPHGKAVRVEVDLARSSPSGPHETGVIVRLALRIKKGSLRGPEDVSGVEWSLKLRKRFEPSIRLDYRIRGLNSTPSAGNT